MGEEPNHTTASTPVHLSTIQSSLERRIFRTITEEGLCIKVGYIEENPGYIPPSYITVQCTVIHFVSASVSRGEEVVFALPPEVLNLAIASARV